MVAGKTKLKINKLKAGMKNTREIFFFDWLPGASPQLQQHAVPSQFSVSATDANCSEGICFIPADLSCVTKVRDYIDEKSRQANLSDQSCFEIALIGDELVANAILASYSKFASEYIVLRWKLRPDKMVISVLDYGGGFNMGKVFKEIPRGSDIGSFVDSLREYRKSRTTKVPISGKVTEYTRFGRGLRIIAGLASQIWIEFHNAEGKIYTDPSADTIGTIITVEYKF